MEMMFPAGLCLAHCQCSVNGSHYHIPSLLWLFVLGPSLWTQLKLHLYPGVLSVPWNSWWPLPSQVLMALGSGARSRRLSDSTSQSSDFMCVQCLATSRVEMPWFSFSSASRVLIEIWRYSIIPFELKPSNITSLLINFPIPRFTWTLRKVWGFLHWKQKSPQNQYWGWPMLCQSQTS